MLIGIYNPYRKTFGGGEQYLFSFAAYFLAQKHTVVYFSDNPDEGKIAAERFGLGLKSLTIRPAVFEKGSYWKKIAATKDLDILLFYSDGSIPFSFAKKTYIIFQFPVPWVKKTSIVNKAKLSRIHGVIVNSRFTKKFIDASFPVDSHIIYPAISIHDYSFGKKEEYILSVGRFTKGMNTKRQDILIEAFKKAVDSGLGDWKLVLVGGVLESDWDEVEKLKQLAAGYPVTIEANISRNRLLELYRDAAIYWHASGFGVNEEDHPERVEHFGISTVEAMASGAIPFVYPAGGQKEVVENGVSGYYWHSIEELIDLTKRFATDQKLRTVVTAGVFQRANQFDRQQFNKNTAAYFSVPTV